MKITHMILIAIVVIIMTGCTAFDEPKFQPNQYNLDLQLKIVPTTDFSELEAKYKFKDVAGLIEFLNHRGRCKIYIPMLEEVRDPYTMCILGHEVFHCILGNFHKPEDSATCYRY